VQEVKVGQVNVAKPRERDGVADENAKSKTWFVLQHQQAAQGWKASEKTWAERLPYRRFF